MDTRLTNVQRDVLKNELIVDHLKEEVAEHIMDNSRDCEEIIEVLADCDSKIDRLRNKFGKLERCRKLIKEYFVGNQANYSSNGKKEAAPN